MERGTAYVPKGRGSGSGRGKGFRAAEVPFSVSSSPPSDVTPRGQLSAVDALSSDNHELKAEASAASASDDVSQVGPGNSANPGLNTLKERNSKEVLEGKEGSRSMCLTNFFKLRKAKDKSIYEYFVSFSNGGETSKTKRSILKQLEGVLGQVYFDGQALYLPYRLPEDITVVDCNHPTSPDAEIKVTIRFVKDKPFQELTQFFTLLFQRIMLHLGYIEIRRGFYDVSDVRVLHDQHLQVWPGVSLGVEAKDDGVYVMIDSPNRLVRTNTIHDHYIAMKHNCDPTKLKETFANFVTGKIIICKYSNQCYKIDDIDYSNSPLSEFKYRAGMITYAAYFKMQYNVTIKDMDQPLLLSKIKPRKIYNPNEAVRVVALVPELCNLTGLRTDERRNYKVMTEISLITRLNPTLKVSAMRNLITRILRCLETEKILTDWGIQIENDLVDVIGRKIDCPTLIFNSANSEGKVVANDFSKESSSACYQPIDIRKFVVFCPAREADRAHQFIGYYRLACISVGIRMRTIGEVVPLQTNTPACFVKTLEEYLTSNSDVQFVIIVIPSMRDDVYSAVKKVCLSTRCVPSQCILSRTLNPRTIQKIALNVCLQINCKLGGALWALKTPMKKVMFIGMDAAHDQTRKNPSVIALVASINDSCTKLFSRCDMVPIHQEVATNLRVMFIDALTAYKRENGGDLPDRIIFFRDGGCTATFDMLLTHEVESCVGVLNEEFDKHKKMVNFSYLCVAKRIPEKIFLQTEGSNIINPLPGTIVDNTITKRNRYDFYCVSQQIRQGTLNPTHYTVLYETTPTKPDVMQKITYFTTFMYYNWQGSIRVPAFIQYAHKLGQLVSRVKINPSRKMNNDLYFL